MSGESVHWIAALPPTLARQAEVLRRLVVESQRDERIRVVAVGCSMGRGVADEHSDVDAYLAVAQEHWRRYLKEVPDAVGRLGAVVDQSHKEVTPVGGEPYQLTWVLFSDGVQLELVVAQAPAELRPGRDWAVLHDPDGRVKERRADRYATIDEVREWAYEGWSLLLLCAKYVTRGSLWEALETLHAARTRVWRLWAAARHIPDAQYGLTAVLDADDPSPPSGIETTHATLDRTDLARAALACADLLNTIWTEATRAATGSPMPLPNAAVAARRKLTELEHPRSVRNGSEDR